MSEEFDLVECTDCKQKWAFITDAREHFDKTHHEEFVIITRESKTVGYIRYAS